MKHLLIVEDDASILRGLTDHLTREHFKVDAAEDGKRGYAMAKRNKYDAIILDLMLPELDGFEVCKKLRSDGITTPILMLTSKGDEADKVLGLEFGADDYLTKPFSVRELTARIRALLRREVRLASVEEFSFGSISVDFKKQEAFNGSKPVKMSAKEFQLLKYFVQHAGEVVSRNQLLDDVWGYEVTPTTRTVDNYVLSLRKKIEKKPTEPKHLLTIHTAGYKFVK